MNSKRVIQTTKKAVKKVRAQVDLALAKFSPSLAKKIEKLQKNLNEQKGHLESMTALGLRVLEQAKTIRQTMDKNVKKKKTPTSKRSVKSKSKGRKK